MADGCNHDCDHCSSNCSENNAIKKLIPNGDTNIKKIIGVSSGKGGVGKSFVTSLIAASLQKKGYKCGIIDADILGPSIPRSFGIKNEHLEVENNLMKPKISKTGIKIISSNFLLAEENEPIIYRGMLISSVMQQFYTDVDFGDLDFLFIDMPPGTGDVALTTYQMLPIDGVIIVSTPQSLVNMIVEKSINMAEKMNIEIIGLIENMSYVECPNCKTQIKIFGESDIEKIAKKHNVEVLSKIPIRENNLKMIDEGHVEDIDIPEINSAIDKLVQIAKG